MPFRNKRDREVELKALSNMNDFYNRFRIKSNLEIKFAFIFSLENLKINTLLFADEETLLYTTKTEKGNARCGYKT